MRIILIVIAAVYVFARPAVSHPVIEILDPEIAIAIN